MALKAVVDKVEDIDAKHLDLYEEKDGKHYLLPIEGLKPVTEFDVLSQSLRAEREAHKTTKKKWEPLATMDPKTVREQLDRIPELETLAEGKVDDAKIDKLVDSRIKARMAPVERERDELKTKVTELDTEVSAFKTEKKTRSLHDVIRKAAKAAKIQDSAIDDAVLLGERVLEEDASGRTVVKADSGYTAGITPEQWFNDLLTKKPHWWGESNGGGARARNNLSAVDNPFSAEGWNLTKQGVLIRENRDKAEQYAKQAGTTIGGRKPAPVAKK